MPSLSVRLFRSGLLAGVALVVLGAPGPASLRSRALSHPHAARAAAALLGTLRGTYTIEPGNPDVGRAYALSAAGTLRPAGAVHAEGSLHTPGFVARGRAAGSLTRRAR